jgi:hypothetical protein
LGYQQLLVTNNDGIKFVKFRLSLLMYGTNIWNFVYIAVMIWRNCGNLIVTCNPTDTYANINKEDK